MYTEEEEEEDIYLAQTMTTLAHNRTIILIGLLSQVARKPEGQQSWPPKQSNESHTIS